MTVRELDEVRTADRDMAIAPDGRALRPDPAIDLYELCGGSSGRDSMNSLNTASSWSSLDSAVIADRSRTLSLTRMRAVQRTASAIASDGRQSTSISR